MNQSQVIIFILNYNGRELLAQCMGSIVKAAEKSLRSCKVVVIDNDSTDDSLEWLKKQWPGIECIEMPNRGLASFNEVLEKVETPYAILLNNDVKLDEGAIDPLINALEKHHDLLFSAPYCLGFDNTTYEGMLTRVNERYGLVQGLCRYPGHEKEILKTEITASSGPVLAVDRVKFLSLGGYDPIYFPGRLEDLDLGFRGWMQGWKGLYVPESRAWHKGFGSFEPTFGEQGCDQLALRNTLIFTWCNIRGSRLIRHFFWLGPRLLHSVFFRRGALFRALREAFGIYCREARNYRRKRVLGLKLVEYCRRQEQFFERFSW